MKKEMMQSFKRLLAFIPDKTYIKIYYYMKFKKRLNLKTPRTFSEKIQWLKLNDRKPIYSQFVDKYEVREYIKEKIGEEYLVPIYGIWENFDDIDFNMLPNQFVLKCTHDSGGIVICKDKENFNKIEAKKYIEKCLKNNFYYIAREWPYKNVKPRIIAEKYLESDRANGIVDYKFMCFNQKMKCCFACFDRDEKGHVLINIYDEKWNKMPFNRKGEGTNKILEKPMHYEKMIQLAEKLSYGIPFARIDFYEINNKIYFGEITLYPAGGFKKFEPEEYDKILGEWLKL